MRALVPAMLLALAGCDSPPPPAPPPTPSTLATGENVYRQTCHTCHGSGIAGAPRLGNQEQWRDRVRQGHEQLYQHAINGYTGRFGTMPARGGKPDLSDERVKAAVDYMLSKL